MIAACAVLALLLAVVVFAGPWPTYRSSRFADRPFYRRAAAEIRRQAASQPSEPGPLRAGWGESRMAVPAGTPLAGYGDRNGRGAAGEHDRLSVRALALSSLPGEAPPTAVIAASDLLIVPANIASAVRRRLERETDIRPESVIFNATHTHSGPGASTRGLVAGLFAGRYDRAVEAGIVDSFVRAIAEARARMQPARVAWGSVDAPGFIRNRTRSTTTAPSLVDAGLDWLLVEQRGGARCIVVRYSAHATVLGPENMLFSADFPGFLRAALEARTRAFGMYLGGALGSMGPNAPEEADAFARARSMGEALAALAAEDALHTSPEAFVESAIVRSIGLPVTVPPLELRLTPALRLSPVLLRVAGISRSAWVGALRLGDLLFVGIPADLSGKISCRWRRLAAERGVYALPLSFNGAYVGYISPDASFGELRRDGKLAYETGIMSWCGPDQEAFFTALFCQILDAL